MKFILIFIFALSLFAIDNPRALHDSNGNINTDFSANKFKITGMHKKLGLTCTNCHLEKSPSEYSSAMNGSCRSCHGDQQKLIEATGALGHNDNIHAGPHYENLDCDNCHKAHTKPVNMCIRCHTQNSMKKLIVK